MYARPSGRREGHLMTRKCMVLVARAHGSASVYFQIGIVVLTNDARPEHLIPAAAAASTTKTITTTTINNNNNNNDDNNTTMTITTTTTTRITTTSTTKTSTVAATLAVRRVEARSGCLNCACLNHLTSTLLSSSVCRMDGGRLASVVRYS